MLAFVNNLLISILRQECNIKNKFLRPKSITILLHVRQFNDNYALIWIRGAVISNV